MVKRGPCPCGVSSDAFITFNNGSTWCFRCNKKPTRKETQGYQMLELPKGEIHEITDRGITEETCRTWGVTQLFDDVGNAIRHYYPWYDKRGEHVATHVRNVGDKTAFPWMGNYSSTVLFGQQLFPAGSARAITLVEGELDALAAYQMFGSRWPVVSVHSSGSAERDVARNLDYLLSFEEVYVCMDEDAAGHHARDAIVDLLPIEKTRIVRMEEGYDPCQYLEEGKVELFKRAWWAAERYSPDDIIVLDRDAVDSLLRKSGDVKTYNIYYPPLQEKMQGWRMGEMTLLTAFPKVGKSALIREFEWDLIQQMSQEEDDPRVGMMHIEDPTERTILSIAALSVNVPFLTFKRLEEEDETRTTGLDNITKTKRLVLLDRQGSFDPDILLNKARYLRIAHNCRVILFDNISMLFSGLGEKEEPKAISKLVTRLKIMGKELGFHIIVVSHLNDDGVTLGSRTPMRVCDNWINIDRDIESPDVDLRRKTKVTVRYCRETGDTGPAGVLWMNPDTGRLEEWIEPFDMGEDGVQRTEVQRAA